MWANAEWADEAPEELGEQLPNPDVYQEGRGQTEVWLGGPRAPRDLLFPVSLPRPANVWRKRAGLEADFCACGESFRSAGANTEEPVLVLTREHGQAGDMHLVLT